MSTISSVLTIVEKILTVAGPLVVALIGDDKADEANKVIDAVEAAMKLARMGLTNLEQFADDLREIEADLLAMNESGGVEEEDFVAAADRIGAKTDHLQRVVAARATR